jgi:hypothetical protein
VGFVRGPAGTDPQGVFSLKVDLLRGVRIIRQADLSVRDSGCSTPSLKKSLKFAFAVVCPPVRTKAIDLP